MLLKVELSLLRGLCLRGFPTSSPGVFAYGTVSEKAVLLRFSFALGFSFFKFLFCRGVARVLADVARRHNVVGRKLGAWGLGSHLSGLRTLLKVFSRSRSLSALPTIP